jgi:SpoVK/Ycf46/Vps4 family AAA+-type ATPase
MVFCGLPDEADRAAILAAAARRLPLAPDVDLAAVAAECSGLTGADLVALLSEAQLLAVHDVLMACQDGGDDDDHGVAPGGSSRGTRSSSAPRCEAAGAAAPLPPRVKVHHLRAALARARPSLPPSEAARLGAVYERFIAGRDPGLSNRAARAAQETAAKHATLA